MSSPRKTDTYNLFSNQAHSTSSPKVGIQSKPIIDEEYLRSLEKKINESYPKSAYPKEDIDHVSVENINKNAIYQRYNPFNLRLPFELEGYTHLYNHNQLKLDKIYYDDSYITYTDASITYLNFLKQYNLAYIAFLRAINDSEQATAQLKELFTTQKMFLNAGIYMKPLSESVAKPSFLFGLLAYLTLDIVFSKVTSISTSARIRALECIRLNFDIEKIAKGFNEFSLGYHPYDVKKEPVYDMIPRRFVTRSNESGGTPHNNLFIENDKIKEIFQINASKFQKTINLDSGISILLNKYPNEVVQVLQSLLKCHYSIISIDKAYVFTALVGLAKLDGIQKGNIFGINASFRNNGESQSGLENRVGWVMGSENFGDYISEDELNNLSNEELKMRVRQSAYRIHQLEAELVEIARDSILREVNVNNDPKGYFAILLLHPNTPEETFEELLKRNYKVLALKYHPDKPNGDERKFKQLQEAYEFLLKVDNRKNYCSAESRNTVGKTF